MQVSRSIQGFIPVSLRVLIGASVLGLAGSTARAELIYGLTTDNNLFTFDSATPGTIASGHFITGLLANESLVGIDVRPTTGAIYGVSSFGVIYSLNPNNGAATGVASIAGATLNGTSFDVDFDPTGASLRLVSDADQYLSINASTGVATVLPSLTASYGDPNVAGLASTSGGTLYAIDAGKDSLNTQNTSTGVQTLVASTKDASSNLVDVTGLLGFDISNGTGNAYVAVQQGGNGYSQFSSINLANGVMSPIIAGNSVSGLIGGGLFVRDIAAAVPEPASLSLAGLAAVGLMARRRKA